MTVTPRVVHGGIVYLEGNASSIDDEQVIEGSVSHISGVRAVVSELLVPTGWMGLLVHSVDGGVVVEYIYPSSPAARGGIVQNDLIIDIDGQTIRNKPEFDKLVREGAVGQIVSVTLHRGSETMDVELKLKKKP
jgi:S1-C subfamily serine protease